MKTNIYILSPNIRDSRNTVNIRYRHTLGTPKKCACIVNMPASDIRYRHKSACIVYVYGFFFLGFLFGFFLGFFFGFFFGVFFGFFFFLGFFLANATIFE